MIDILWSHTGYLALGFCQNLLISALAMLLGTIMGGSLGMLRQVRLSPIHGFAGFMTNVCRNVPSFVLLFYMAFMLPAEFIFDGERYFVPVWIKATLALTFPVIGFFSDQVHAYHVNISQGRSGAMETLSGAWTQYFLIILMASATASVIGVDEIVSRANVVAAQSSEPKFLLLTYAYVSLWFLATGLLLSSMPKLIKVMSYGRAVRANR